MLGQGQVDLSCQFQVGIHPQRGQVPSLAGNTCHQSCSLGMSHSSCTLLEHTCTDSASNTTRHLVRKCTPALCQGKFQGQQWMMVSVWNTCQFSSGLSLRHGVIPAQHPHSIGCSCIISLRQGQSQVSYIGHCHLCMECIQCYSYSLSGVHGKPHQKT